MEALEIDAIDAMSTDDAALLLGDVLEDAPDLARLVVDRRPFGSVDGLVAAFDAVLDGLDPERALVLLRAHPELGSRAPMAAASVDEQASAGLTDAEEELRTRLATANQAYRERFGFPFVLAMRGRTAVEVLPELERRVANDPDVELAAALAQVREIARLRIGLLVGGAP
ncbi:MAG: 2-oxo-4-hydroxy-4-carboxy-5-ureidoimidazoline decarboxylase [Actinobacteria bacterium]|nr:2-oxo-4-hydroxy-4-carboxy-5-ureidoimidazoline decarboxylase [Actinomycetota bacterium]